MFFDNFVEDENDEVDRVVGEHDGARRNENIGDEENNDQNNDDDVERDQVLAEVPSRPKRNRRAPDFYGEVVSHRYGDWEENDANAAISDDPKTFRSAITGDNANNWKAAIDAEMQSLRQNETWDLVDLPPNKNVVGCKWVFKTKHNADGTISKHKARLVAQGFTQKHGVDYEETFAPVVKYASLRTIFAIANQYGMEIHQMDVNSAYLNGDIDAEIYMRQPEGYIDPKHPNKVCKLKKGLYGLKQGGRIWNEKIDKYLKSKDYNPSDADPCIYVNVQGGKIVIIALYVDDTIIVSNCNALLATAKKMLNEKFDMTDLGEVKSVLGMSINRNRDDGTLTINQSDYVCGVLERFGMTECKPVSTPLETGKKFLKTPDDEDPVDTQQYQEIIGSLVYLSISTRPDIAEAVGKLSQHMGRPNNDHWVGAKRVLRYLKGTTKHGLIYRKSKQFSLFGYSDSDWAGCVDTRKSTSGFVFMLGDSLISWASKKQPVVALSTTEAEYIALCLATQEAMWLRRLLDSVQNPQEGPTLIYEDNQGTICIAKNPRDTQRTKHIDIRYHFVRESVQNKVITIEKCESQNMIADTFTKQLPRPAFERHRTAMNISS